MPLQFASKSDYTAKLTELLMVEAECERIKTESIAADNVPYTWNERLEIYSRLTLMIPKNLQQFIRKHVVVSVAIRQVGGGADYLGTGMIKNVRILRKQPNLIVTLQIDALNPLDRKQLQATPSKSAHY
mmetsp:Transcript_1551/g.2135  ORF Transcript_1551/g.2135 Transcript_1551/m.2135 type:complete len:129 (-) Transcript_1551:2234-2620(-)